MANSLHSIKENPKFWRFLFWLMGLQAFLGLGVLLLVFVLALSGLATPDEAADFLERYKFLNVLSTIVFSVFAYRLAAGTYDGAGLFVGKTWGTMFLAGWGILIGFLLAKSFLGEQAQQGASVFIGLAALILSIFALIIWPRKFFYQAVERAKIEWREKKG